MIRVNILFSTVRRHFFLGYLCTYYFLKVCHSDSLTVYVDILCSVRARVLRMIVAL